MVASSAVRPALHLQLSTLGCSHSISCRSNRAIFLCRLGNWWDLPCPSIQTARRAWRDGCGDRSRWWRRTWSTAIESGEWGHFSQVRVDRLSGLTLKITSQLPSPLPVSHASHHRYPGWRHPHSLPSFTPTSSDHHYTLLTHHPPLHFVTTARSGQHGCQA